MKLIVLHGIRESDIGNQTQCTCMQKTRNSFTSSFIEPTKIELLNRRNIIDILEFYHIPLVTVNLPFKTNCLITRLFIQLFHSCSVISVPQKGFFIMPTLYLFNWSFLYDDEQFTSKGRLK